MIGIEHPTPAAKETAALFKNEYDGGRVLMQSWYNEYIAFSAIPSDKLVYEGTYRLWGAALGNPDGNNIRWIITRCGTTLDEVCKRINPDQLEAYYLKVGTIPDPQMGDTLTIYRHR
jgi:hypothetical protein